jgi:hypothetical protein
MTKSGEFVTPHSMGQLALTHLPIDRPHKTYRCSPFNLKQKTPCDLWALGGCKELQSNSIITGTFHMLCQALIGTCTVKDYGEYCSLSSPLFPQADVFDVLAWRSQLEGAIGVISTLGAFGANDFMYKVCLQRFGLKNAQHLAY